LPIEIPGMSAPAIQAENLHVEYRSKNGRLVHAVKGLSFSVEPGEVVGFLGPNGAGKSSTIKAIMGFLEPKQGTCRVFDLPCGSLEAKRRIGYLPEVAMYYPYLSPLETLCLYGELQGLRGSALKKEATELLELVGLKDSLKKRNKMLSKGMLQRVGIAQSLLGTPELLVLDEVTSGLDPVGRKELRKLLKDRQSKGTTLFFSSHELSEVDMLCDRILLINEGSLVEERGLEELKSDLRQYVLVYAGAVSLVDLANQWTEEGDRVFKAHFATKENLIKAIERVQKEGKQIVDIVAQEGSLEDYFVETIRNAA
jgi:ABC-2 type transport system ATP-binding protein